METSANIEVETRGKRSLGWRWPLVALVVVFLAVAVNSKIGLFLSDPYSLSFRHQVMTTFFRFLVPIIFPMIRIFVVGLTCSLSEAFPDKFLEHLFDFYN